MNLGSGSSATCPSRTCVFNALSKQCADSHSYERFLQLLVIYMDGIICLTTGDNSRLLEDAQVIKPHMMAGVPRVWNRRVPSLRVRKAVLTCAGSMQR